MQVEVYMILVVLVTLVPHQLDQFSEVEINEMTHRSILKTLNYWRKGE
jgi:hypothetical protein